MNISIVIVIIAVIVIRQTQFLLLAGPSITLLEAFMAAVESLVKEALRGTSAACRKQSDVGLVVFESPFLVLPLFF